MNPVAIALTAGMTYQLPDSAKLLQPVRVGATDAANRIFMAPLTRSRAQSDGTPSDLAALYYAQRAAAGLSAGHTPNQRVGRG